MNLFTHCAHREMERDMESGHRERVTYGYRILMEAAILGTPEKMAELWRLLQDDPAILDRVMWECRGKDNPLHVGALHGNVEFVKEILSRKRELTHELNSEGQSPLHLASARGHVEVVRELLSQDADVCLTRELNSEGQSPLHLASAGGHVEVVKEILSKDAYSCFICDRDGMISLHLAAIQGRLEVLEALVNAEKITAFILTKSEEPILHLCANNNKSKAIKKLIELVEEKDRLVNLRDRDGNTVLHLVSAQGNHEVIKFLVKNTGVDVNAENTDGFTALDISLQDEKILTGSRIQWLLTAAGANRARKNSLLQPLVKWFDMKGNDESKGKDESWFLEALLVVAILMATVAFQARLNPPGGVWQDTALHNATLPNATQSSPPNLVPHYAGKSIMSYLDPKSYNSFAATTDGTLLTSLLVIQFLLASYIFKSSLFKHVAIALTCVSLLLMSQAYYFSATYISLDKQDFLLKGLIISSLVLYIFWVGWTLLLELKLTACRCTTSVKSKV